VRTLVKRLRGRIRVRDSEAASGTVFEVCLPSNTPETTAAADSDSGQTRDATRTRQTVPTSPPFQPSQPS
jgi:hypothetical protein